MRRRPPTDPDLDVVLPEAPEFSAHESAAATLPDSQPMPELLDQEEGSAWAIVLAGGIGSRFWPLSTADRPKPVLALVGSSPLISESVSRLAPFIPPERVLVVTSRDIAEVIHAAIPQVPAGNILIEARPLGTAAALAWGAHEVSRRAGPRTICTVMHSDLACSFADMLRGTLRRAGTLAARHTAIVAVGVKPSRPETAFGYVVPGLPLGAQAGDEGGAVWARDFVEKPAPLMADDLIAGGAVWNAGILTAEARVFIDALAANTREVAIGFEALEMGDIERFTGLVRSVSIERGLLERTDRRLG
jgi:mannose-1-phosphate guanylyltransferase